MLESIFSVELLIAILRATTPILFSALAASVAAKSGITNMALEGIMLFSALFGVVFSSFTGNFLTGLILTMVFGGLIGFVLAFFVLKLKTDEILAAVAINLMATGGTVLLLLAIFDLRGSSSGVASNSAPVIGGQNLMTWLAFILVVIMHLFLYKTPLGLKIHAVGENKHAAESVGISAEKIQYIALILSGVLASMGGFFLSGGYMNMFTKDMSAGKGFIALAASGMGGNTPIGAMLVSLLFGMTQALASIMQLTDIPTELIQMTPYLVTLIGLGAYSYSNMKKKQKLAGK